MEAFREFYIENGDRLFGYLLRKAGSRSLAADLVQETFTRYLERYRHRELSVALLFTMARHIFFDHVRQQRRHTALAEPPDGEAEDGERRCIVREESRRVLAALQQLDEDERDLLAMVACSGLTYQQIAAVCACSEGSVKVRVHRARQKLRKLLPEE